MFEEALCVRLDIPTSKFFEDFESSDTPTSEKAKIIAICNQCKAREECHEYGESQAWGVWGGEFRKNGKFVPFRDVPKASSSRQVLKMRRVEKNLPWT